MATTFNMFDLIFVILSFIFILVAFFRGFVKELFALLNWIITISLSYLLAPYASRFVEHYSSNKLIINVASGSIVFVLIFIAVFLATRGLSHDWKEKMPEHLDRILGVFYGVFKSLLIAGLFYSITLNFYSILLGDVEKSKSEQVLKESVMQDDGGAISKSEKKSRKAKKSADNLPDWLLQAKCFPIIKSAGEVVDPLVSSGIDAAARNLLEETKPVKINLDDKVDEVIEDSVDGLQDEVGGSAGALAEPKKAASAKSNKSDKVQKKSDEKDTGYSKKEIEKMNRLIEIVN